MVLENGVLVFAALHAIVVLAQWRELHVRGVGEERLAAAGARLEPRVAIQVRKRFEPRHNFFSKDELVRCWAVLVWRACKLVEPDRQSVVSVHALERREERPRVGGLKVRVQAPAWGCGGAWKGAWEGASGRHAWQSGGVGLSEGQDSHVVERAVAARDVAAALVPHRQPPVAARVVGHTRRDEGQVESASESDHCGPAFCSLRGGQPRGTLEGSEGEKKR